MASPKKRNEQTIKIQKMAMTQKLAEKRKDQPKGKNSTALPQVSKGKASKAGDPPSEIPEEVTNNQFALIQRLAATINV